MHLYDDVERKIELKRKILFSHDSKCLFELISSIEACNRKTLVFWAFECAESIIEKIKDRKSNISKSEAAIVLCREWAKGIVKMPEARKAILSVHGEAETTSDKSLAALYHAVGQACSTVHAPGHAPGLIYYELTSMVIDSGYINYKKPVSEKIEWYSSRLGYWKIESQSGSFVWADFLKC